jgi:hypothetical protein
MPIHIMPMSKVLREGEWEGEAESSHKTPFRAEKQR